MNKYLSMMGYQGPNSLLVLIILGLLYKNITSPYPYLVVIAWQFLSHLINIIIKIIIKAPRPDSDKDPKFSQLKPSFSNFLTIHRNYGMPSGHAQSVISESLFIALYFKNTWLTAVAATQALLTLWQRYETRRHSLTQLAAGSLLGVIVGLTLYKVSPYLFRLRDEDMITKL